MLRIRSIDVGAMGNVAALVEGLRTLRRASSDDQRDAPMADTRERLVALEADDWLVDAWDAAPMHVDVLGFIGRSLWEGMVTIGYVRQQPDVRLHQLLAEALRNARTVIGSKWGNEMALSGLGAEEAAWLAAARQREKAYRDDWNAKGKRERFDFDQCAELPPIEEMARAVEAHDQYDVVYRLESARAVHWGLQALFDNADDREQRVVQTLVLTAASYRMLILQGAGLAGMA